MCHLKYAAWTSTFVVLPANWYDGFKLELKKNMEICELTGNDEYGLMFLLIFFFVITTCKY